MKEIIKNILTKIKDSGNVKIDTSYLKDNSWFSITDEVFLKKVIYIFRSSGELLISENGDITKAKWENLIHSTNSMLLEINDKTSLYNIIYLTSEYLVLQKDGTDEVKVFIKQQRYVSKLPKGLNENPIEIIFNDLNVLLNENNIHNSAQKNTKGEIQNDSVIEEIQQNEHLNFKQNGDVFIKVNFENSLKLGIVENSIREQIESQENEKFKYFDLLVVLELIRENNNGLTKAQETDIIIELQEREEELIDNNKICKYCKAIDTIENDICLACGKSL